MQLPLLTQLVPLTDGPASHDTKLGTVQSLWQHGPATPEPATQLPSPPLHSKPAWSVPPADSQKNSFWLGFENVQRPGSAQQ